MIRRIAVLLLVLVFALAFMAWRRSRAPVAETPAPRVSGLPDSIVTAPATDPGVTWTPPGAWRLEPARAMRLATYRLGGPGRDDGAECAVFFFGKGIGGGVDDNVDRWAAQFVGAPNPRRRVVSVAGLDVTRVEIRGTFLAPGADMRSQGQVPDWSLLGAIVQGPRGLVFFKFTGPAAHVSAGTPAFDAMLATLASH